MREGWQATTLGEVAEVVGGGTPSTTRAEFWDGDIVWLTPTEVVALDGRRVSDSERKITKQGLANSGARLLPRGTVILTSRASVGFVAVSDCELCTNQGFQSLVPQTQILAEFLLPWVQTNRLEFMARSAGSTFKEISKTNVATMTILLPPLAEQHRIVDVIEAVDAYVASLESYANAARTARAALLHELLTTNTQGWKETTLGEVAEVNPKELRLADDAPFIPMDAVKVGKRRVEYTEPRGSRSGARADSGDVLFARITPCLENGKVAQIQDEIGRCGGSTEFIVIRATTVLDPALLYLWATWERTRGTAAQLMTGTTGRQRLAALDLSRLEFLLPPLTEQKRIVDVIGSVDGAIAGADRAAEDARNLRSGLLSDLLSGDHEITEGYDELLGAA